MAVACASPVSLLAGDPLDPDQEIAALRRQVAQQQTQIDELRKTLDQQATALERLAASRPAAAAAVRESVIPVTAEAAPARESGPRSFAGMQVTGDFRLRADVQARSGNSDAPPLQNLRSRYRVRVNLDRDLDRRFKFHLQLSTGPYNVATTNDQDMAGGAAKPPFSVAEAWMDYHPTSKLSLRAGRMEEAFADNMRFLWDDDIRFNGFQQIVNVPLADNALGVTGVEFRAGEYILTNPAVYVLPSNSPYAAAGYQVGQKVRDSNLFHPGVIVRGRLGSSWNHQLNAGVQLYRNPGQIQLASTMAGYPVLINNSLGLSLSGPAPGTGNATTTPGGAVYSAPNFQVLHLAYRLERRGVQFGGREMPAWLDFQAARNVGAGRYRDAYTWSANLGSVKQGGDVRLLYQYAIKDANSMISQFTDDDLGTGSGVNIAVHGARVDLGLTRFLQLQNLVFIQRQRRPSDPAHQMFVPLPQGANPTLRYLGQLAFTF